MKKEEILNKEINKEAGTKLGVQYNQKIIKIALRAMQKYADQQLNLSSVSQQRELLKAFGAYLDNEYPDREPVYLGDIELFLASL